MHAALIVHIEIDRGNVAGLIHPLEISLLELYHRAGVVAGHVLVHGGDQQFEQAVAIDITSAREGTSEVLAGGPLDEQRARPWSQQLRLVGIVEMDLATRVPVLQRCDEHLWAAIIVDVAHRSDGGTEQLSGYLTLDLQCRVLRKSVGAPCEYPHLAARRSSRAGVVERLADRKVVVTVTVDVSQRSQCATEHGALTVHRPLPRVHARQAIRTAMVDLHSAVAAEFAEVSGGGDRHVIESVVVDVADARHRESQH